VEHTYAQCKEVANKCYDTREEMSVTSKQLVPSNETYLCSMQRSACGAWTHEEIFPLRVKGVKLQRIYGRHYLACDANFIGNRLIMRKRELTIG
jgi:hypothetical protein